MLDKHALNQGRYKSGGLLLYAEMQSVVTHARHLLHARTRSCKRLITSTSFMHLWSLSGCNTCFDGFSSSAIGLFSFFTSATLACPSLILPCF